MINITYEKNEERSTNDNTVLDFSPINFCFVGPRGVGKTSLLASMYQEIKKKGVIGFSIDLNTVAGRETQARLDDAHEAMLEMIDETPMHGLADESLGIAGSAGPRYYEITGEKKIEDTDWLKWTRYKTFRYKFGFTDIPGTYYLEDSSPQNAEAAANALKNSLVSFLAIDTPALMDSQLKNKRLNTSERIASLYESASWEKGHTVIIVLSRCEKYWRDREFMIDKIKEYYGGLVKNLKSRGVRVFITWVKTLGGMEFDFFSTAKDPNGKKRYIARFLRTGDYAPENCATPLQIALHYGLARLSDHIIPGPLDWLGLANGELAKEATEELSGQLGRKLNAGGADTFKEL